MSMHAFAGLILALQTEEGIPTAPLIETDHPRLILIHTPRETLELGRLGHRLRRRLLLHF